MHKPFRILQLTDTHLWADPETVYRGWRTDESLQRIIEHILATQQQPDAVLLSGDLAHDQLPATYERLRERVTAIAAPVWALPGNHDDPLALQTHLQPDCYLGHRDLPGWRVILLNSHIPGDDGGRLDDKELRRLHAAVNATDHACLVVVHHPAWPVHSRWLDKIGLDNGTQVLELLTAQPQARILLCGHIHQAFDGQQGHLRLLATPSTCRQFRPQRSEYEEDAQPPGFRWLDLMPDGRYATGVERVPAARSAWTDKDGLS